jgi:acyl-CoA reductase-like NAD-dependent aldehyde dehydrogenase
VRLEHPTKASRHREKYPPEVAMNSRKCTRCEQVKPLAEFYARNAEGTLQSACKACVKARAVMWAKAHPRERREILRRHGAKKRREAHKS